jgi:hypothetical protein
MPIEIKELVIRAVVQDPLETGNSRGRAEGEGGPGTTTSPLGRDAERADQTALVEECVRQVLNVLKRSRER